MSLFDSASLVVTPNGYKEDKLYSIKPTDGSGDLVVTRATTATRVNSDGLIEQVPYNLLTFSNTFTNAIWTKDNVSLTSGITSPSGLNNAFKLVESATTGVHSIYQTFVSLPSNIYTTSIYVKKGERFKVAIADRNSGAYVSFNLNTGTIISSLSLVGTIELLNNDWYRLTAKTSSAISVYVPQIFILEDSYTTGVPITLPYAGNGTSGIFIYAAQFEAGATAKEYFPTTDRLDVPRLDYTNSSCPSILVEPQRTNLALRSQELDSALVWFPVAATVSANNTTAPDGTVSADKVIATAATSTHIILQQPSGSVNGTATTVSIFAKAAGLSRIQLVNNAGGSGIANYNLSTGTATLVSGVSASIQDYANGWYRCIMTYTPTNTGNFNIQIRLADNSGNTTFLGNGVDGVSLWGGQVELGSNATSYIPTIASSVTRNADVISKTGISSLIGQTEGTLFADIKYDSNIGSTKIITGLATGTSSFIYSFISGTTLVLSIYNSGTLQCYLTYALPSSGRYKIAMGYKLNDFIIYINGANVASQTSGSVPSCSNLYLGNDFLTVYNKLEYNSAILFKTRLSNTELAQLTTI